MIRITRKECPACLENNPNDIDRYGRKKVVSALWEMQFGKCCYSEVKIPDTGHGKAVEHFQPKSIFPKKKNVWKNLLLVCPQCNGKKSDRFPVLLTSNADDESSPTVVYISEPSNNSSAIIDPSSPLHNPEAHLDFVLDNSNPLFGQIIPRNRSVLGRVTIQVTGIDESYFMNERFTWLIDVLEPSFRNILRHKNSGKQDALEAELRTFAGFVGRDARFSGLARAFAREKRLDTNFNLVIPGYDLESE